MEWPIIFAVVMLIIYSVLTLEHLRHRKPRK